MLCLYSAVLSASEIQVAVASNFVFTLTKVADRFEQETGHRVVLVKGSTGKQYAQIRHGAPFDLFFAADSQRPVQLEQDGLAVDGSRITYAIGRLVLWSSDAKLVDDNGDVLSSSAFQYLAIANPELAPYGRAALQVLQNRGLLDTLEKRIVRGENVNQALQFVASGHAQLGFVALSHLRQRQLKDKQGSYWLVPADDYQPIEQQSVLLSNSKAAREFLMFVQSKQARALIAQHGYGLP